jgi:hypothetical protein
MSWSKSVLKFTRLRVIIYTLKNNQKFKISSENLIIFKYFN